MSKLVARAAFALAACLALRASAPVPALAAPAPASAAVERSFHLMGTVLEVSARAAGREAALDATEAAFRAVSAAEARLSTWTRDSELARLNRAPVGRPVALSPLLRRDLLAATRLAERSGHAFSPFIGPLVEAWGLRSGGAKPARARLAAAMKASAPGAFAWMPEGGLARARPAAALEEGGFGKGAGLDDAASALQAAGATGVLDFGGQILVAGAGPVSVALSDPSSRDRALARFEVSSGSVSTSSNAERAGPVGHLLDPRTGRPAPFRGAVTVHAPTALEADALSTALFVMGPERGLRWAGRNSVAALWIEPAGAGRWRLRRSRAWRAPFQDVSTNLDLGT